jgi:large subunit ribosomal protein L16
MLSPKKLKWKKTQRGKAKGLSKGGFNIDFGEYGLCATTAGFVDSREIEAARVSINKVLKREGNIWIRIFPHKSFTKRAAETRMGKGKGDIDYYCAVIRPGRIMFEVGGVKKSLAEEAFVKASHKLSVKTKFLMKGIVFNNG